MGISVPTYRNAQVTPNGQSNAFQQIDTPAAAFGTLQAEGLVNGGKTLMNVADALATRSVALAEQRNKASARQAESDLLNWQVDYLHNPSTGAYLKRGSNAMDVTKNTIAAYQKRAKEIADGLENDDQKARFSESLMDSQNTLLEQVSKFERDELYAYGKSARDGLAETYKGAAIANAESPGAAEPYIQKLKQTYEEDPAVAPEEIDARVQKDRSSVISTGINSAYQRGDFAKAVSLYDQNTDLMTGDDAAKAKVIRDKADMSVRTTSQSADIIATSGTEAEAIARAREDAKDETPEYQETLLTKVKADFAANKTQIDGDRATQTRAAWKAIDNDRRGTDVIPPWADAQTRAAMNKLIVQKASGTDVQTDPATYRKLKTMARERPGEFATTNLSKDLVKLDKTARSEILDMQETAAAGLSDEQLKQNNKKLLSATQIGDSGKAALRQSFGDKWYGNKKNAATREKYLYQLDLEVEAEAERQGKEGLPRTEVDKIARRLLLEGKTSHGFMSGSTRMFETDDETRSKFYVPYDKIPEGETVKIRRAIAENNKQMIKSGQRDRIISEDKLGVEKVYNGNLFNRDIYGNTN